MHGSELFIFFISVVNFIAVLFLFNLAVIQPMIEAVQVRGQKVETRLKEIAQVVSAAKATEADYQQQFGQFDKIAAEMRAENQQEADRVKERLQAAADAEAIHLVNKAQVEADKQRSEALAKLQKQMVDLAIGNVEASLRKLSNSAVTDVDRQSLTKVGKLHVA